MTLTIPCPLTWSLWVVNGGLLALTLFLTATNTGCCRMVTLSGPFLGTWCQSVRNQGAHHLVSVPILVSFGCSCSRLPLTDGVKMEIKPIYFILNL